MKTKLLLAGTLTLAQLNLIAQGQYTYWDAPGAGPYIRAAIGPSLYEDAQIKSFAGSPGGEVEYTAGFSLFGAIGYGFNDYIAADFEAGISGVLLDGAQGFNVHDSTLFNAPFLFNLTFSLPLADGNVVPYVGGGAGGSVVTFDADAFGNGSVTLYNADSDVVFAWQIFAGLKFIVTDNIWLGFGYKYLVTEDPDFNYPISGGPGDIIFSLEGIHSHNLLFTFNWEF